MDLRLVQTRSTLSPKLITIPELVKPKEDELKYRYSLWNFKYRWDRWTDFLKDIGEYSDQLPTKEELIQQYNECKIKYNDGKPILLHSFNLNNPKYPGLKWSRWFYNKVFGSWAKFREAAEDIYIPDEQAMIDNYFHVKAIFTEINPIYGMGPLDSTLLNIRQSKFNRRQYDTRFAGYLTFLRKIGEIDKNDTDVYWLRPSRKQLEENYAFVKRELGRSPTIHDMNTNKLLTLYGYTSYVSEFGSWPKALQYFGDWPKNRNHVRKHHVLSHSDLRNLYYKLKQKLGRSEKEYVYPMEFFNEYKSEQGHVRLEYGGYLKMLETFKESIRRNCVRCGKSFCPRRANSICCSQRCNHRRLDSLAAEQRRKRNPTNITKKCKKCGQDFVIEYSKSYSRYCSEKCGRRFKSDGFVAIKKDIIKKICIECSKEFETSYSQRVTCSCKCKKARAVKERKKTLIDRYGGNTWK